MERTRSLPSSLRLIGQLLLLGFFLTPVMAIGQDSEFAETLRLAQEGNAAAQYNLGFMYLIGEGVPINYVTAYAWFNVAAVSGSERASKNRSIVEQHMTPTQIGEAQKLSIEIYNSILVNQ